MTFVDEATIRVMGGRGGHGCLSFRREKYRPRGGPDGGNGGRGGCVHLVASSRLNTLVTFRYQARFAAPAGERGRGSDCAGRAGRDVQVEVPVGTLVRDAHDGQKLGDLVHPGRTLLVAQGGSGGLGNAHFRSSVNRTPRQTTEGTAGESRTLQLELQLLADVGLVGYPNAGKSSLIRAVSAAQSKVADYPFTTLQPHLGVVCISSWQSFVMADLPGLIEGSSQGAGLGDRFLRHVHRNRILCHVIDASEAPDDPAWLIQRACILLQEVGQHEHDVSERVWVLNKCDQLTPEQIELMRIAFANALLEGAQDKVFAVSAMTRSGLNTWIHSLFRALGREGGEKDPP